MYINPEYAGDISDGSIIITTPGFLRRDKGFELLLQAYNIIRKKYDVKLILAGEVQGIENIDYAKRIANELTQNIIETLRRI